MLARNIVLAALSCAIGFSIVGCNPTPATPTLSISATDASRYASLKGDATKGKDRFIGTCSACHGHDAKGLPGLGKDLTASAYAKGLADADLISFIVRGRPASDPANVTKVDMPPRGGNPGLGDQDIADIVAYLRTFQK